MRWALLPYRRYFEFRGRSRRTEYWPFALGWVFVLVILAFVGRLLGDLRAMDVARGLFVLGTFIPGLAVTVRRLHDANRTGWWAVLPFLPFLLVLLRLPFEEAEWMFLAIGLTMLICPFILIVMLAWKGTTGPNRFGADPRHPDADLEAVFG